jgi:acetyl esterase/lipase
VRHAKASHLRLFTANQIPATCHHYLVISAEHDMLRDGSQKLARTLCTGQNDVDYRFIPDVTHIFLQRSSGVQVAHDTIIKMGRYLAK